MCFLTDISAFKGVAQVNGDFFPKLNGTMSSGTCFKDDDLGIFTLNVYSLSTSP